MDGGCSLLIQSQAREEALALREKLEAMESLLETTKVKLAATKETIDAKDRRLLEVCITCADLPGKH